MDGVPHVFEVQDLDLDGGDEAVAGPADPVISVHRVMVREGDKRQAETPRLEVEAQGIDLPGRDNVVGVQRMNVEVGRGPAFGPERRASSAPRI